jgi:hypothetical protein
MRELGRRYLSYPLSERSRPSWPAKAHRKRRSLDRGTLRATEWAVNVTGHCTRTVTACSNTGSSSWKEVSVIATSSRDRARRPPGNLSTVSRGFMSIVRVVIRSGITASLLHLSPASAQPPVLPDFLPAYYADALTLDGKQLQRVSSGMPRRKPIARDRLNRQPRCSVRRRISRLLRSHRSWARSRGNTLLAPPSWNCSRRFKRCAVTTGEQCMSA